MRNPLMPSKAKPLNTSHYHKSAGILDDYATRKVVQTRELKISDVYHAYGGFQDVAYTLAIGADSWTKVTNVAHDLWVGAESNGVTLSSDEVVIEHTGDYAGAMSVTFQGANQKDYLFRIYNVTQSKVNGYHLGATGWGANNYVNISMPIYLEATAGDHFRFEVYQVDGDDIVLINSVFYLSYLHE